MYDLPSIVLGICICITFGMLVAIINLLVEKALYCRSERKKLVKHNDIHDLALSLAQIIRNEMEVLEDE